MREERGVEKGSQALEQIGTHTRVYNAFIIHI